MPDRTRCIYCQTIGFVRWEQVIKGGTSYREYYCGHCGRSWRVSDGEEPPPDHESEPAGRLR